MMQKVSEGFDYFYDLADASYDAAEIRQAFLSLNHMPTIDRNPRRGEKNVDDVGGRNVNLVDAVMRRYFVRSGIERVFCHLHEAHGGKFVRVRSCAKVLLHLMFGLIVIEEEGHQHRLGPEHMRDSHQPEADLKATHAVMLR